MAPIPLPEGLPPLYLITDRRQLAHGGLADVLELALAAGVRLVQLREKDLPGRDLLALARQVKGVCDQYGANLLINGRVDVALALGAGVHLPGATPPVAAVRGLMGPKALIGVSTHHIAEIERASAQGASFATFGPVFDTPSKRGMGDPVGVTMLANAVRHTPMRIFALGGIHQDRVARVMATGCHGVALISDIMASPNPGVASARILNSLSTESAGRQTT